MGTKSEVTKQSGLRIMDNLELYQEEQRQALIDMNKGIVELSKKVQQQIDAYEVVKNVEVTGRVEVNTEKEIAVSNLEDLQGSIESLEGTLSKAIKDNSYKPLEAVTVKNIKDALPTELKITNLADIKQYFNDLEQSIKNNQPIVNVAKQDIVFPTDPKKPIPVRITDGKKFIDALTVAVGGGMDSQGIIDAINNITVSVDTTGLATEAKQDDLITAVNNMGGSVTYKVLVDKSVTDIIYIGKATIGTATSVASWQIKKIDKTVTDNVTITYAASGAFTATWTNRGSETYS